MRNSRTLGPTLITITVALLLVLSGLFLVWPTWLTGGFLNLTVTGVSIHPKTGEMTLSCDLTLAYGTECWWTLPDAGGGSDALGTTYDYLPPGFLRWPRREPRYQWTYPISTDEERRGTMPSLETLHQRVPLKPGETFRLRPGEELVYCRMLHPNGFREDLKIQVWNQQGPR